MDDGSERKTEEEAEVWNTTDVLLVVLALSSHRLLRGAATVLRAPAQAVRHPVHLLQRFEPTETEERTCTLAWLERARKTGTGRSAR